MPAAPAAAFNRKFCVAPMMRYSHRHARQLWRLLSPSALLYTEMLTANAIVFGRHESLLTYPPEQAPVALQLGGCDPASMAEAAAIGEQYGYAEININCGCPSARVKSGNFGACLMRTPRSVAAVVAAIRRRVNLPVTVKCRIAVDEMDSESGLNDFVQIVCTESGGIDALIVHARRAWLQGLNPAQNRNKPPLDYERVRRLKKQFPDVQIILNGGITDLDAIQNNMHGVDGIMVGRAICRHPYLLNDVEQALFGGQKVSRAHALRAMLDYISAQPVSQWHRALTTLSGLYHACPNSKQFKRQLAQPPAAAINALQDILQNHPQWTASY